MKSEIIALTLSLLTVCVIAADAPTADDQQGIQGTWTVECAIQDGKPFNGINAGDQMAFANDQFTIRDKTGKEQQKGSFTLDSLKVLKVLVLVPAQQPVSSAPGQFAYALSGETLKLVMITPDKRPTELSDKGQVLITLKRNKAK